MKSYKLIFPLSALIVLSSCATIRFGRTTTVTIETEHPGDVVDILAIGPKKAEDIQQVTLPYKYKAYHNNLPQRLDIVSKNYLYEPLTIGAQRKGETIGELCRWLGYGEMIGLWGLMGGIGFGCGDTTVGVAGLAAGAVIGAPLLAIGYTAETDIPTSKFYLTSSIPVDSINSYKLEGWYMRQKALEDVYTLLNQGDYKLSKAKASFLLEQEPNAELYYLRGISSYYLGKHKDALKDLNESLYRLNVEINPGLREEVLDCMSAVENSIAINSEKRKQMWAQIAGTVLQTGAQAFSMYQQAEMLKYNQNNGMSPSGVVIDPSKLSQGDLNRLADPNFAIQQVLSREMLDYQQFTRYNKKSDGSDYSLAEYRALQGAAIQEAKENGYDILAEQKRQMEEDRKWRAEQRQKDKEDWFARYGYNVNSSYAGSKGTFNENLTESRSVNSSPEASESMVSDNQASNRDITDESKRFDSKQQYKSDPVSSDDYKKIKTVDLYYRDGDHARKMMTNMELCKKGAFLFVKIGNKYYPRCTPNWNRFRNAIIYGDKQLYYND